MFHKKLLQFLLSFALFSGLSTCHAQDSDNGFVSLDSGLQYKVLQAPTDPSSARPKQGQKVEVHYTGWLQSNNKKFDSSVDRGRPLTFIIGRGIVIQGWEEAVRLMRVGEKRTVVIPPSLAYGSAGMKDVIPANATLVFDLELLSIE